MMKSTNISEELAKELDARFFAPLRRPKTKRVGVELEFPVWNRAPGAATDFAAVHEATVEFLARFPFTEFTFDDAGALYRAKDLNTDADCNGHMNNTYYVDYLCDQIPELENGTHRVSTVRIHFSKEAVVGDTMEIWMSPKMEPREGAEQDCRYLFRTVRKSDGLMNIACEIGLVPVKNM